MSENSRKRSKQMVRVWAGGLILIALAGAGLWYLLTKQSTAVTVAEQKKAVDIQAGPVVKAFRAGMSSGDKGLVLIGEARPYQSVTLYAKTSGYMNRILVDKGDKVRSGQLLATIVSPEIDQAYNAAVADLENKKKIAQRDQMLLQKEYISKEEAETSATAVAVAEAQVKSLKEQMTYKNIIAPFSGTITARFADAGALVQNATNSQTSAQPIVTLSQLDRLRIYVYLSQPDAAQLKIGEPVTITLSEKPGYKSTASISRIAGELDPKTRMMLAEIDMQNDKQEIIPGSYLQVSFKPRDQKNLTIPSEALVIKAGKYFAPVITGGKIHYRPITVDNNNGVRVSVASGIATGDTVGVNVSQELQEGSAVRVQM
jgi:membrane fusion protein, multidrug efflux system